MMWEFINKSFKFSFNPSFIVAFQEMKACIGGVTFWFGWQKFNTCSDRKTLKKKHRQIISVLFSQGIFYFKNV